MFGDDDLVGFGYVGDRILGQGVEPFVLGHGIQQYSLFDLPFEVDTVEDVAQEIVDLHAHRRVEIIQV